MTATVPSIPPSHLHVRADRSAPSAYVERLGNAGLIPFVGGALLSWLVSGHEDAHFYVGLALAAYAAVIISFLGGIHWGLGMLGDDAACAPTTPFTWGIVPSLVAWIAVIMPAYAGLVIEGLMLVVCYLVDRRLYPTYGLSAWLTLRFRLTVVATLSCFLGAASL